MRVIKLISIVLIMMVVSSCEKDRCNCPCNGNNQGASNELVGTTWKEGHPTNGVGFYLEFTSNNQFTITGMYVGSVSSSRSGTYVLNNRNITFTGASCSTPNGVSIKLNSATFNSVKMTAQGTQNGKSETFTLTKM